MRSTSAYHSMLLAILVAISVGCDNTPPTQPVTNDQVKVTIVGIPSDADSLNVSINLNNMVFGGGPHTYTNSNSVLWVELPLQTQGMLSVAINALQGGCQVATGEADIDLTGDTYYEMTVTLNLLPSKLCTLTVTKNGGGQVTANPAGINCGQTCSFDYAFGTTVTLTGVQDSGMNPGVWSGACTGGGPCVVTIMGPTNVAIDFAPKICSKDGWCWINPTPQGNDLAGIWASPTPDNTMYAVGAHGTILRWNGIIWVAMNSGTTQDLYGIWGSGANDIWAVGKGGTILQWNGSSWFASTSGVTQDLIGIWGSKQNDMWAVGANGTVLHYTGAQWISATSNTTDPLSGVWGSAANDVWAVGGTSTIHYDGTGWTAIPNGGSSLYAVWGSGTADVWAVGTNTILHWLGAAWAPETVPSGSDCRGVWGSGSTNVWIANKTGPVLHWGGSRWTVATQTQTTGFVAVSGIQDTTVWAVGSKGRSIQGDGTNWNTVGQVGPDLRSGWAASPSNAFALGMAGDDNVYHWDGATWQSVYSSHILQSVWGSAPDDVWAVGSNIVHWDGMMWSAVQSNLPRTLHAVFGSSSTDIWAVGLDGENRHWDGNTWTTFPQLTENGGYAQLQAGYADSRGAWAVSEFVVYRLNGTTWQKVTTSNGNYLSAMAGFNNAEIFAVGGYQNGIIMRWDGTTWQTNETPAGAPWINGVFVGQAGNAWSVGNNGAMYHWNGTMWSPADSGTDSPLLSIFGSGPMDMFTFGANSVVLRKTM